MDLGFGRLDGNQEQAALPVELAVLMIQIAARQATTPTATTHARAGGTPEATPFAPHDGAFNGAVARTLAKWKEV